MKKILCFIILILFCQTVYAVEYQVAVMPATNQVTVSTSSSNDTLYITITNLSQDDVSDFFLTTHSSGSMIIVENIVDGNSNPTITTEVSDGAIYSGLLSSRFIVGTFSQSVSLKLYSYNSSQTHYSFCGKQPFGFFGIANPIMIDCCIGIRGNIDNDQQDIIDISDLVFLVDFMFTQGPSPVCPDEANIDGDVDSIIDISDLVLLVDFMFSPVPESGPADCP